MRLTLLSPLALAFFISCGDSDADSAASVSTAGHVSAGATTIQWIDSARNYGRINEGQKLAVSFRFRNSGNKPLVIQDVRPTCGCTVADFPKEPIAPGQEGEITGEFDSNGREGLQQKHITVRSNANPPEQDVSFEVNVVAKPGGGQNTGF